MHGPAGGADPQGEEVPGQVGGPGRGAAGCGEPVTPAHQGRGVGAVGLGEVLLLVISVADEDPAGNVVGGSTRVPPLGPLRLDSPTTRTGPSRPRATPGRRDQELSYTGSLNLLYRHSTKAASKPVSVG